MNRLTSAATTATTGADAWSEAFSIDPWGNMKQSGSYTFNPNFDVNNRISQTGYSYDAAGNLLTDSFHTYTYDAEERMKSVDTTAATYTYGPDGERARKDFSDGTWNEYVYFGGQVIAEKSSAGDWTDYIFANGQRIAKAEALDNGLRSYGTKNASGQWAINYFGNAAGLTNYTIQNGDKLYLTQYQLSGSKGGVVLNFTDGTSSNWGVKDKEGYYLNDDQTQANTHFRTIDLSSLAGKVISKVGVNQETDTANGAWAMIYEQISLVSLDGTVHPIYTGQTTSPITSNLQSGGETGIGSHIDVNRGKATSPTQTTTYYLADHLGSSRLIASGNGYPIWSGVFLPYGQEWNPQITMNHYKFTGDEHDAESNLDHTWFRQYEGTQGRWLSPDPAGMAAVDSTNPQSLNMYEYVLSNPMSLLDPDGLDCLFSNSGKWYSNSSYDEETCYSYGGYWVGGSAVAYTINPDGTLTFLYKDSNGNPASSTTSGDNVTVSGPPVSSDSFLPGVNFIDPNSFGLPSAGGGKQTNGNATIGPVGTITNGTPKVQYCHEQANKAFLANLIPGGDILFQHGFTPEAAAAAGLDVAGDAAREYAGEKIINTAANGATWLGTLRKAAGLTAKDARMAGRFVGVAGTSYTIYKALKASQKEWDYCME